MDHSTQNTVGGFRRTSLAEQVADALREQIQSGSLESGTALRDSSLTEALDVSRNTLREALRILEGEDLVRYELHKGVVVTRPTAKELDDLYTARLALEPFAVTAIDRHTEASLTAVKVAAKEIEIRASLGELDELVKADLRFHTAVIGLAGSEELSDFHTALSAKLRRALLIIARVKGETTHQPELVVEEHMRIANSLLDGQVDLAERLVRGHIEANRKIAVELFESATKARRDDGGVRDHE